MHEDMFPQKKTPSRKPRLRLRQVGIVELSSYESLVASLLHLSTAPRVSTFNPCSVRPHISLIILKYCTGSGTHGNINVF